MKYGLFRPVLSLARGTLFSVARRGRAIWQQRRFEVGTNVRIHPSVQFYGEGKVSIGSGAIISKGVIFRSAAEASIEIGSGSFISEHCTLEALPAKSMKLGSNFRLGSESSVYASGNIEWGDDGIVGSRCQIGPRESDTSGQLRVGNSVRVQHDSIIDTCADITIGSHVHCGPACAWYTHNHIVRSGASFWDHGIRCLPITLGSRIWIGYGCVFLPGAMIENDTVIATKAVVNKPVIQFTIVGGIPAKQIGTIGSNASSR